MRSAGLVGVAQTIACCGEIGGIGRRCAIGILGPARSALNFVGRILLPVIATDPDS
jgi:hypothetical protein